MTLPEITTPEALANHMGWSERRVRDLARRLGACRILGNRMTLTKDDVHAILEASRPCPLKSTNEAVPGAIHDAALTLYPRATAATRNRQAIVPTVAVINHAAESELCARIRVKRFKVETKSKIPATLEWVEAFRKACRKPQLGALALFMFLTGARVSEALAVEWHDIDFQEKTVLIKQTKLGNERRAHLPQPLIVALANLPRSNSGRGVFWYETRNHCLMVWRRTAKRAKIAPLSMHSCRHGFATALLRSGVDVVTVAKLGGWKSARHVLDTYGHAVDDITLTDLICGTPVTQRARANARKPRKMGIS